MSQLFVIANEVKQSMPPECMDRHGLRPRDDGNGYFSNFCLPESSSHD